MRYTTRPLSDRTWLRSASARRRSQFEAAWSRTLSLLDAEVRHLRGRDVVIECDVREQDIRIDGGLRSNARAASPAVVVAFDTAGHGPMLYRADRFTWGDGTGPLAWQANVRAVALTLQSLRAVDRYGATETGQQYAGFKALPSGTAMPPSHMTSDEAWSIIGSYQTRNIHDLRNDHTADELKAAYRRARAANHPDRRDGDRDLWDKVEQAAQVLGVAS